MRRKFDEARKATNAADSQAKIALEFIRELYLVEKALWSKDQPISMPHEFVTRY